jgi:cell division protein DivIC
VKKTPVANGDTAERKKPGRRIFRRRIFHWLILLVGLSFVGNTGWQLWRQQLEMDGQIAELNEKKTQLVEQQKNLQLEIVRLNTPSYIEQLAREQLGLVRRGEIMIAPKK